MKSRAISIGAKYGNGLVNFGDPQFVKYLIENYG